MADEFWHPEGPLVPRAVTEGASIHGLEPMFCDYCARPIGLAARWLLRLWREWFCSDACRCLAEWHAPERR